MSTLLNVIIVLGIVIAGSFLLFFLGDFFLSVIDAKRKNVGESVYKEEPKEQKKEFVNAQKTSVYVTDYIAEEAKEVEEKKEESAVAPVVEEVEEDDSASEEEERRIAEARAALERRKAEILKRMQAQIEEDDEEEELEEEEVEEEPAPIPTPVEEEVVEKKEDVIVGLINDEEDAEEEKEKVDTDALQAEIEALKNQLGAEKEKYQALEKEFEDHKNTVVEPTIVEVEGETIGSREYYEKMLEEKMAQLKLVEKEYKQCKKDFLPLYRVNNTLAKDEKKLHRREAIVAKQKVVLYGVNNYADIDEEKAKKLAEDLDLLDGLKLSVSHCKEVMAKNQERYPILERLYNSLKTQVEGLKSEIENIKTILESDEEVAEEE